MLTSMICRAGGANHSMSDSTQAGLTAVPSAFIAADAAADQEAIRELNATDAVAQSLPWGDDTRHLVLRNDENSNPPIAYIDDAEKSSSRTTKVIYSCLDPEHLHGKLPKRSSFHFAHLAGIRQWVLDSWTSYGYSPDDARKASVAP